MKLKNSVRKKLLTGLLIGTALAGVGVGKSFADTNLSDLKPVSKEVSDNIINEMARARSSSIQSYIYPEPICKSLVKANGYLYLVDNHNKRIYSGIFVDPKGHMLYFNGNGRAVQDDWMNINQSGYNGRYYFGPQYKAHKNTVVTVRGRDYFFDKEGHMKTGFQEWNGETYYFDPSSGIQHKGGMLNLKGNVYSLNSERNGAMTRGWLNTLGGWMYFLPESGVMTPSGVVNVTKGNGIYQPGLYVFVARNGWTYKADGFYTANGNRYYFDPGQNGRALQGKWLDTPDQAHSRDGMMYFDNNGHMAKGVKTINGETYVFTNKNSRDHNYYRDYGWYTDTATKKRYYFTDGVSARSATEFRSTAPKGAAVKGKQIIDGKTYEFDQNGVLK